MGTWGTGPFDNDTAADFAGDLDDAPPGEREALVRGVLARTVSAAGYLDEAQEAVAAAALIAAQCPGGRPVETVYVIGTRVSDQRFMIICSERGRKVPEGDKAAMNSG